MAKIKYVNDLHLSKGNIEKLETVNLIIDEYAAEGYRLTLRQLYYQLVSRDIIPNKVEEYNKLSSILVKGRMAGEVDWDAIEDRIRVPIIPYSVIDIQDAVEDTILQYRLNRQRDQENYIEVWVEKDALSGVLKRITTHYHVKLMVNRGYSSCTAMHDASDRFGYYEKMHHKMTYILYLGDHDPSGLDMIRDVRERLLEFGVFVTVIPIALTQEQIKQYNPPPNPAKVTDPRAKWYLEKYGNTSWEVDALNPKVLNKLLKSSIESLLDIDKFNKIIQQENEDKETLRTFAKNL